MQKAQKQFKDAGVQIVGVSPDKVEVLKRFADSAKIEFPLLSDEGSQMIKAYGLLFQRGLPHPGTIVIDKTGVVRGKIFREGYRDRHTNDELLTLVKNLK